MGHAIPKIQYNLASFTGDSDSTTFVLTNVSDTSLVAVNQTLSGPGIPVFTKVVSKTADSITLSAKPTLTQLTQPFESGTEIVFEFPPIEKNGETVAANSKGTQSISGVDQTVINYIEGKRNPDFSHISNTIKLKVDSFVGSWAIFGKEFRYFEDQTTDVYVAYRLDKKEYRPEKQFPKGTSFVWGFGFDMRRVIS